MTLLCDLETSPELSYLLGVRYGDMTVDTCVRRLALGVNDKDFAEEFVLALKRYLGYYRRIYVMGDGRYVVSLGSKASKILYDYFTLPLVIHKSVIERYPSNFLRGFSDSEGSVTFSKPKAKCVAPLISMYNDDREILEYIKFLLKQFFCIEARIYTYRRRGLHFILRINKHREQWIFFFEIGFSILRKQVKLMKGLCTCA